MNKERLLANFLKLVQIDSESKNEKAVVDYIKSIFAKYPVEMYVDDAGNKFGGNSGNLIIKIKPNGKNTGVVMLNSHVDTVKPGNGIRPIRENGMIKSSGDTILAADAKSGVAQIIETVETIFESNIPHSGFDLVFTVGEEIGLFGAKYLDYSKIDAKKGYVLDGEHVGTVYNGAPSQNSLLIEINGKSGHAAMPEYSISAIRIAADAIAAMPLGKVDFETTSNIGMIEGGLATNIVTEKVILKGEVRSHNEKKLEYFTSKIVRACWEAARNYRVIQDNVYYYGSTKEKVIKEYSCFHVCSESDLVKAVLMGAEKIGIKGKAVSTPGGSDANIFNEKGIDAVILGTGMGKVHTVEEFIKEDNLYNGAELLLEIVK